MDIYQKVYTAATGTKTYLGIEVIPKRHNMVVSSRGVATMQAGEAFASPNSGQI